MSGLSLKLLHTTAGKTVAAVAVGGGVLLYARKRKSAQSAPIVAGAMPDPNATLDTGNYGSSPDSGTVSNTLADSLTTGYQNLGSSMDALASSVDAQQQQIAALTPGGASTPMMSAAAPAGANVSSASTSPVATIAPPTSQLGGTERLATFLAGFFNNGSGVQWENNQGTFAAVGSLTADQRSAINKAAKLVASTHAGTRFTIPGVTGTYDMNTQGHYQRIE